MISSGDRAIIRSLAERVREIAELPIMQKRRDMWTRHNRLESVGPMILVFPEGAWRELLPWSSLECSEDKARVYEYELKLRIFQHEHIHDDKPVEANWIVRKVISNSGWGLKPKRKRSSQSTGAWAFDPVIRDRDDLKKLRFPEITYDEESTLRALDEAQDLLGDILDVKLKGIDHVSFHFMAVYCDLRGLEQVMWDMCDDPGFVHEAMSFLEQGYRRMIEQYVELNLLSLNNDETYHSSGGLGYTTELPQPDCDSERVRPCDMWASAESQEMAQVSPAMHHEFVMEYEKRLLEPFGLNGYGCCEDLTRKLDYVMDIPNIRRISISPWADVEACARKLKDKYIYSWKPDPSHLVGEFNAQRVRDYIQHTLDVTGDCIVEMILKDTHTCENHPERFTKWTDIAQELVAPHRSWS
ncbi:MAG: hypothetical protein GXX08_06150 [Firmicutes bacterium]|nr:hypothetical protein [Bacillota bacterium]